MEPLRLRAANIGAFLALLLLAPPAIGAPVDDLVAAAKKEGVIEFYAPSTLTPQGAQALGEAFNKRHGLSVKLNYHSSGGMTRDVGRLASLAAAGQPPDWDVMVVHDAGHSTLWLRKLHKPFDYRKLGIDPRVINFDNGTVVIANQFALQAYNSKVLPAQDVPKRWEDLLDPKWKGGKLGMGTATHHLARLATVWGEEKTTEYVKALAGQKPSLGRLAEIYTRLLLGEILVAITQLDEFIHRAKVTGAPIVFAEGVQPVIAPGVNAGVLKGARHANAGHLFTAFLTTPEAQEIWEKYQGQTSAFVPGTKSYKYAQGKKVLFMTQDQAEMVDRLTAEYGKIFGFTK
ncbi:MAG: extracellular solute-binding protein [Deltaproteobacteria bacterium]|nr:extracellular solute-binding protein [Deltaproteobacteria bacterium]